MGISRHFTASGRPQLPDMAERGGERYEATAVARLRMDAQVLSGILSGELVQGDVLSVAAIGGISGARKASDLLPLGQPLLITGVMPEFHIFGSESSIIEIHMTVRGVGAGVETAALMGACAAATTIYDLLKLIDSRLHIEHASVLDVKRLSGSTPVSGSTPAGAQSMPELEASLLPDFNEPAMPSSQLRIPRLRVIREGDAPTSLWSLKKPKLKKAKAKPKPKPKPKPRKKAAPKRKTTAVRKPKAKPKAKPRAKPRMKAKPKPKPKPKPKSKPRAKAKSKAKPK